MSTRVGLVTDSNSQIPIELAARYGVEVVPVTLTIDGEEFSEGETLTADDYYARTRDGDVSVATSQPSPGQFAAAYERLAATGVEAILSVHVGAELSGTLNSARLAAQGAAVPVHLVDTETASFGVTCCLWEAAEALAGGASIEAAAGRARSIAAAVGNVFVVAAPELARRGGRIDVTGLEGIPVIAGRADGIDIVGEADDLDHAVSIMSGYARSWGQELRVAVGVADVAGAPLSARLEDSLRSAPEVDELVRYRVGPSVAVHTGPGTAGAFFYTPP